MDLSSAPAVRTVAARMRKRQWRASKSDWFPARSRRCEQRAPENESMAPKKNMLIHLNFVEKMKRLQQLVLGAGV
ncbi:hypothetical protein CesoFtcFv8_011689 [Champsocephalus esox]|uniref:Uncharacterized protein n=1 Tax=Champsocephalus esox TaxID=159716 RepID=A0AAN8C042_9TELE|nr:hypothetical protein CesoFtcFv8_011689 [Champsocephalus esox]